MDRPQQGQAERRYSEGGAPAEDLQGGDGGRVVAVGQRPVETVGRHDDKAGEHRGQRRPGEAVVGLKDTGEDHRHPVHGHLEGEHAQKGGDELVLERGVDPLGGGEEGGDGGGEDDEDQRQRGQHGQDQTEQPGGRGGDLLTPARSDRGGQERDHGGGQNPADHDLVEGVGELVGGGVGARHRAGADGGGLNEPAQEAQGAGDQGQAGDRAGH